MTQSAESTTSRLPNPMVRVPGLQGIARELSTVTRDITVPQVTTSLAHLRMGQMLGSDYFVALHERTLREAGVPEARINAVEFWRESDLFTEQEAVSLELAEALLTAQSGQDRVSDDLYARAAVAFDEKALTSLLIAFGQMFFYVPLALVGKPIPGVDPARQWRP